MTYNHRVILRTISVSYTHLDVYKRQSISRSKNCLEEARIPMAMARSKWLPRFRIPAGDMLMVILPPGYSRPEFTMAERILSLASFTVISPRPTIFIAGIPLALSLIHIYLQLLKKRCIAIVGSRKCTQYGKTVAKAIGKRAAENGVTVVLSLIHI